MSSHEWPANWSPISFDDLEGWKRDDHSAAFSCFRISARSLIEQSTHSRTGVAPSQALLEVAEKALQHDAGSTHNTDARQFFETHFQPLKHADSSSGNNGFVTGYFEPEVAASRTRTNEFSAPLYSRPPDLVRVEESEGENLLPSTFQFGRLLDGRITEYYDRNEIESGALDGRGLELFWLRSRVDAFFIHIQGSARLLFESGSSVRVSYAGKSGHPYTPIGRILIERGLLTRDEVSMDTIRNWLQKNPDESDRLMQENRSFIFFQEVENHDPQFGPVAGAGVQLTPGRSLAVDNKIHAYGTPVWIRTKTPLHNFEHVFERLMIAQDTGSAIVGARRGDLFIGSGREAGNIAGSIKHEADFIILAPRVS